MSLGRFSSLQQLPRFALALSLLLIGGLLAARMHSATEAAHKAAQESQSLSPSAANGILAVAKPLPVTLVLHTATLLPNGKVLVAGGSGDGSDAGASNQAFLYDPKTGDWVETGLMKASRKGHFAVLLQNGRVLVGGGKNGNGFLNSSETYDPVSQTWTFTAGAMTQPRHRASATLLANAAGASGNARNGFALVIGGESTPSAVSDTAEYFNPTTGLWKATANKLSRPRVAHSTTVLTGGDVLIAGGYSTASQPLTVAELYDPLADKWRLTESLKTARLGHTATLLANNKVLVAGGIGTNGSALATVEAFDAASEKWSLEPNSMPQARAFHSASLLPNGSLFVVGGFASLQGEANNLGIVYSPDSRLWTSAGTFGEPRGAHTATILANARVLIVGGAPTGGLTSALMTAEFYDPAIGKWLTQGSTLNQLRFDHTATLMANGRVLFAGGRDANGSMKSAEIYDPGSDTWTRTADMNVPRADHTATLLRNGKVLVAGGINNGEILDSADVYDPVTGSWALTTNVMLSRRSEHTATLLADGRVLAAGGWNNSLGVNILMNCDLYDPATNRWTSTGALKDRRRYHTATLLFDGRVLAAGGEPSTSLKTSELYDPNTGQWTRQNSQMHIGHLRHTATLLPNGKVLVVSGLQGTTGPTNYSGSAHLFDPSRLAWDSVTAPAGRDYHAATLLANGKVLITGGYVIQSSGTAAGSINNVDAVELYDPARGVSVPFNETTKITFPRDGHTATLLPNGRVLVAGGRAQVTSSSGVLLAVLVDKVELFDVGLDAVPTVIPGLAETTWNGGGSPVCATGVRFQGGSEATSGNITGSGSNHPVVQLMRLDNEQTYFLSPDPNSTQCSFQGWTNNSYASLAVPTITLPGTNNNLLPGIALMTVFVNGIPNGKATILAPEATAGGNGTVNLTGRIYTVADTGLQVNVELRSSTGEVRNVQSGPNGEYIFEDVPTHTPGISTASVVPPQLTEDSPSTPITVTGSGFTAASQIIFNGIPLQTTFISSTELRATIPATSLQNDGYASIVVRTTINGVTTTSTPLVIRIAPPAPNLRPIINSLSPASTVVNSNPGTIAINGVNLLNGTTQVLWNGQIRPIVAGQSTATRLVFTPNASDFAQAGTATVAVQNAGGLSNSAPFTIMALPPPIITGLNPSSTIVGIAPTEIAINGTNLLNTNGGGTTQVLWNGQSRPFIANRSSATQIVFVPQRSDFLQSGIATVRVFHRTVTTNGETQVLSNVANFIINQQPGPTISSLSPASFTVPITSSGSIPNQTLIVNGTNFVSNSVIRVNGRSLTTTVVSPTQLTAVIPGALIATQTATGTAQTGLVITVLNPSTNLTSNSALFAVNQTPPDTLGSVLVYPFYTSSASNPNAINTTFSITNTNTQQSVIINLLFVEGSTGQASSYFETLGANQTQTFRASDYDRGVTGYLLAVASNTVGFSYCPIPFNFLRGSELVTTSSGYSGSVSAIPIRGFTAPSCNSESFSATLSFNGSQYNRLPSQITADSIYSASQSASTLLAVSAVGGNLVSNGRASAITSVLGTVVDSSQNTYSFSDNRSSSQIVTELNSNYPLTTPRLDQILPPGQAGKLTMFATPALFGMTLTRTPSFNLGTLMRTVALKTATLTIPVYEEPVISLTGRTALRAAPPDAPAQLAQASPRENTQTVSPRRFSTGSSSEAISGQAAAPTEVEQQLPPGTPITYTITPSGNVPNGAAIEFVPQSRTVTPGGGEGPIGFVTVQAPSAAGGDFCGKTYAGIKISGTVFLPNGYAGNTVAVGLTLTNAKKPDCQLPTDIPLTTAPATSGYVGENIGTKVLGLGGSYLITPSDNRFQFRYQPLNGAELDAGPYLHPPLANGASIDNNFNAYVVNTCPPSITATANGEASAQVCQGQPIMLETPAVPGATSYIWTLPNNSTLNGRTPVIPSATLANTGMYKVQVSTPTCVLPVETMVLVTVNPLPAASAGTDQTQCKSANGPTIFTLNGAVAAGTTLIWSNISSTGDALATIVDRASPTSTVNVTGTGTVTLRLTSTSPANCGAGGEAFDDVTLTVSNAPDTTISTDQQMFCANSSGHTASVPDAGAGATYNWTISGGSFTGASNTRQINFSAGASGNVTLGVTVMVGASCAAANNKQVPIQTITVNPQTISQATTGMIYTQTFTQTGGSGAITWSQTGALPTGLSFSSTTTTATISGTPSQSGSFPITVTATDANTCPASRNYTLVVNCDYTLNPTGQSYSSASTPGSATVTTGSNCAWTAVSNDNWIILNSASNVIGNATVNYTVQANTGPNSRTGTMTIAGKTLTIQQQGQPASGGGLMFYPLLRPLRLLDTRPANERPGPAFDTPGGKLLGLLSGGTPRVQQARVAFDGQSIPVTATAVVGTATVINNPAQGEYTGTGNITFYPSGANRPEVSNLNYDLNQTISNAFTVGLNGAGAFDIFAYSNVHLVIDVVGYYAPPTVTGLYYHPLPKPIRLLETRPELFYTGCSTPRAKLPGGGVRTQQGRVSCDGVTIPAAAQALVGNLTTVNSAANGIATAFSGDLITTPIATTLAYVSTQAIPNAFITRLGGDGNFKLFVSQTTDVLIDIGGYFSAEATDANGQGLLFNQLPRPIRLLETRTEAFYPGCDTPRAPLAGNSERIQQARVSCDGVTIPANAQAVIGNATVVNFISPGSGNVTLYPTTANRPEVSNLNYVANQVIPNAFTVGLSNDGRFTIYVFSSIHLLIDISGYYAP